MCSVCVRESVLRCTIGGTCASVSLRCVFCISMVPLYGTAGAAGAASGLKLDKPFQCSFCEYRSTNRAHVHAHERSHVGQLPPFGCRYCNYRGRDRYTVSRHERTHDVNHGGIPLPTGGEPHGIGGEPQGIGGETQGIGGERLDTGDVRPDTGGEMPTAVGHVVQVSSVDLCVCVRIPVEVWHAVRRRILCIHASYCR